MLRDMGGWGVIGIGMGDMGVRGMADNVRYLDMF
jgi:hypothetical protein